MTKAKQGDTVKVHYTGTLNDGTVFDSSRDRDPLEFTLGDGKLIKGFENAVDGMAVSESKKINIPLAEAYGERRNEMIMDVPKDQFPENITPELGLQLQINQDDGATHVVTITNMTDDAITLDGNHPLAGQDLNFEIELLEIG